MIELESLTKVFRATNGPHRAVDGLTCTIEPGVVTGFLGPNWAGKTTTMRILAGEGEPYAGRIISSGVPGLRVTPARLPSSLICCTAR